MAQINKPSDYFNTVTWTGDNTDRTISGVGFQPDWIWWKQRNGTDDHRLIDSVRGEGTTSYKILFSDTTDAEYDGNDNGGSQGNINAITSDGFSGVQGTVGWNNWNGSGLNYVGWNWLASNSTASNTDGSIASTVSVNTTSGFSIVSWTGTGSGSTIGHGLGVKPKIIFVKNRSNTGNWVVNVGEIIGTDERSLYLNSIDTIKNDAQATNGYTYNNTTTTFSTASGSSGNQNDVNQSGSAMIAYCFAEKKGFSKFGKYIGNGSGTDGTFVYTGFKPALVVVRSYTTVSSWNFMDNKRQTYNDGTIPYLKANLNEVEVTSNPNMDFLSNGFKFRTTDNDFNGSGQSYIFMAFAENPLVGTNNIPTTAR